MKKKQMNKRDCVLFPLLILALWFGLSESLPAQYQQEAGFYTLEANTFHYHSGSYFQRVALRSSPARIWYAYQPADKDPASKPLFVFYNGGPGGATSAGLFCAHTGRLSIQYDPVNGTGFVAPNPSSWTRAGNLLHIDARTTGFSYSQMDNPQDNTLRMAEFDAQNYNSFTDGADFIRVILRFLADHPDIRNNPVILVPESYGGIRSTVILHILLNYRKYANGETAFQNPDLVQEIRNHYTAVFPEYAGQTVPPAVIARQFGHQIMIQVAVSHPNQRRIAEEMLEAPGSPLFRLAAETGVPYVRWREVPGHTGTPTPGQVMNHIYNYLDTINRDAYIITKPGNFFNGFLLAAQELLTHFISLTRLIGNDPAGIPELYASARQNAYKSRMSGDINLDALSNSKLGPVPKTLDSANGRTTRTNGDLPAVFGILQPWDRFFIDLNYDANIAFYYNRLYLAGYGYEMMWSLSNLFGDMFLENVAWVNTFMTNAAHDVVVYSPAIPGALAGHTHYLTSVEHDTTGPKNAVRPGQMILHYNSGSVPGSSVSERTIRFPFYSNSGHPVTLTEPEEMLKDVIAWLQSTGLITNDREGDNP